MSSAESYRIAAIVPCYNEEASVGKVVTDLHKAVPGLEVYVYDNNSTDQTSTVAREAGAVVCLEPQKGKGNVVRRAFADIEADIYLLIDGDDTYDASAAPELIATLVNQNLDHVLGVRRDVAEDAEDTSSSSYRPAHKTGNHVLNMIVTRIFGDSMGDMLSGYRVFSRRFVKSFPVMSREFEIETELTVHSLGLHVPAAPIEIDFNDRAEGSESKLRTYRDGWKILKVIVSLTRHERPITFFGIISALSGLVAMILVAPIVVRYLQEGDVLRMPTLLLGVLLLVVSGLSFTAGLVLDGIRKSRYERSRLAYMRHSPVRNPAKRLMVLPIRHSSGKRSTMTIPAQRPVPTETVPALATGVAPAPVAPVTAVASSDAAFFEAVPQEPVA